MCLEKSAVKRSVKLWLSVVFIQNHRADKHLTNADTRLAESPSWGTCLLQTGSAETTLNRWTLFIAWCLCLIVYRRKQWDVHMSLSQLSSLLPLCGLHVSSHRRNNVDLEISLSIILSSVNLDLIYINCGKTVSAFFTLRYGYWSRLEWWFSSPKLL